MNHRYRQGIQKLRETFGEKGERFITKLREVSPDLERMTVEYPFEDVYTRNVLDSKLRELVVIGGLMALPNAAPVLKVHFQKALKEGCKEIEIVEVIIQMAIYIGFPLATKALHLFKEARFDFQNAMRVKRNAS